MFQQMLHALGQKQPLSLQKRSDLQPKALQAAQEAARQKLENQSLPQSEQVALSKELTEEMDQPGQHQGLEALLANLGQPQKSDQKFDEKVNEVGGAAEIKGHKPKQTRPPELKADSERDKIPKGHEKIGDVRLTARKKSPDSKEQPNSAQSVAQADGSRPGTKGAPKTDAPRPVGQTEAGRGSKPDGRVGYRQLPQMPRPPRDRVELSGESRAELEEAQLVLK